MATHGPEVLSIHIADDAPEAQNKNQNSTYPLSVPPSDETRTPHLHSVIGEKWARGSVTQGDMRRRDANEDDDVVQCRALCLSSHPTRDNYARARIKVLLSAKLLQIAA